VVWVTYTVDPPTRATKAEKWCNTEALLEPHGFGQGVSLPPTEGRNTREIQQQ